MTRSLQSLVVNDDHDTADLLGAILAAHLGASSVTVAYDGRYAVALALEQRPDAAVLET